MEERLRRWGYTGTVWREERSRNTWENLEESKRIVISEDLEGVLLVTDAFHMSRSLAMARRSLPVALRQQTLLSYRRLHVTGPKKSCFLHFLPLPTLEENKIAQ